MRKFIAVLLASVLGTLASGTFIAGSANADTGHVVTIDDVSVAEGSGGVPGLASVSIHVSPAPEAGEQVKVDFGTSAQTSQGATAKSTAAGDSTPEFPEDFAQTDGTVTFDATETAKTVLIPVLQDNADEADETFYVNLFNARGECLVPELCTTEATIGDARAVVTITDDDATPALAINDVEDDEGDDGITSYTFTVTKTGASAKSVTVDYATSDDSAVASDDYSPNSGTLTFPASNSVLAETQEIVVEASRDTTFEPTETFKVTLSNATNATIADTEGVGTITNDDPAPPVAMTVSDAANVEGDALDFTVTLAQPPAPGQTATVDWSLVGSTGEGKATEAVDYAPATGSVVYTAGESEETISVPTTEDVIDELDETFALKLVKPETSGTGGYSYSIADDTAVGTIEDDDAAPTLSVDDVEQDEGDDGITSYTFTVTKTGASAKSVTVDYATSDDSAVASDYSPSSGTLTFPASDSVLAETQEIVVEASRDTTFEPTETFKVTLSNATNATIDDAEGVGTITNDDPAPPPVMTVSDAANAEGDALDFTVALAQPPAPGQTATVDWSLVGSTGEGKATEALDYAPATGSVVYTAGESEQTISVPTIEDVTDELDETFGLKLVKPETSGTGGYTYSIGDDTAVGTIQDDDAAPTLSVDDVQVALEGATDATTLATFTVTKTGATDRPVTVDYATADDSATAGDDYTSKSGELTFAPEDTTKQVAVEVKGDELDEINEKLFVNLSDASNATIAGEQGAATIMDDDDAAASFEINNVKVTEGNSGTVAATFTVTKNGLSGQIATVKYATADAVAKSPADYTTTSGLLSFGPAETSKSITVPVKGDVLDEINEWFHVNLSDAANASIVDAQGGAGIVDDDAAPRITVGNDSVVEDASKACTLLVKLNAKSGRSITFNYKTVTGTAGTSDYVAKSGTATLVPGDDALQIKVFAKSDRRDESTEKFSVKMSGVTPSGAATFADSTGTCSILDND